MGLFFLVQLLLVATACYWASALLAEIFMTSRAERPLAPALRVGFGYVLLYAWFIATWRFMPLPAAWLSGLAFLALVLVAKGPSGRALLWQGAKSRVRAYLTTFAWALLAVNLFLLPLHLARNYGPFTEGGGDVTVYANTPRFLANAGRAAFGLSDFLYDLKHRIRNPLGGTPDNNDSFSRFDPALGNPPAANFQSYRIAKGKRYSIVQFAPTGMWSLFLKGPNYPVFYGVLAFFYALMLLAFWAFFRRYTFPLAVLAVSVVASSYGILSVFYNMYLLQGMSLALCALMLAAMPAVRFFSRPALRLYGIPLAILAAGYTHFLFIILPFLLLVPKAWEAEQEKEKTPPPSLRSRILTGLPMALFAVLFLATTLMDFAGFAGDLLYRVREVMRGLFGGQSALKADAYSSKAVSHWTMQWGSFLVGQLSQQHFPPFAALPAWVAKLIPISIIAGATTLVFGMLAFPLAWFHRRSIANPVAFRRLLALFVLSLLVVAANHYGVRDSLYTQAKGAQNLLGVLYAALLLPMAALALVKSASRLPRLASWILGASLVVFAFTLLLPRLAYCRKISVGEDRASIMGPSFFEEARRIHQQDANAFVLFEPRISADLYVYSQAFIGHRLLPTRHLVLESEWWTKPGDPTGEFRVQRARIAQDYFGESNLADLWVLTAHEMRPRKSDTQWSPKRFRWKAEKVSGHPGALLIFTGYNYEAPFEVAPRSGDADDVGVFSYLRNGAVSLYLPKGGPWKIVTTAMPHRGNMKGWNAGEWNARRGTGEMRYDSAEANAGGGKRFILGLPQTREERLIQLWRNEGEAVVNVQVNGMDVPCMVR